MLFKLCFAFILCQPWRDFRFDLCHYLKFCCHSNFCIISSVHSFSVGGWMVRIAGGFGFNCHLTCSFHFPRRVDLYDKFQLNIDSIITFYMNSLWYTIFRYYLDFILMKMNGILEKCHRNVTQACVKSDKKTKFTCLVCYIFFLLIAHWSKLKPQIQCFAHMISIGKTHSHVKCNVNGC